MSELDNSHLCTHCDGHSCSPQDERMSIFILPNCPSRVLYWFHLGLPVFGKSSQDRDFQVQEQGGAFQPKSENDTPIVDFSVAERTQCRMGKHAGKR